MDACLWNQLRWGGGGVGRGEVENGGGKVEGGGEVGGGTREEVENLKRK